MLVFCFIFSLLWSATSYAADAPANSTKTPPERFWSERFDKNKLESLKNPPKAPENSFSDSASQDFKAFFVTLSQRQNRANKRLVEIAEQERDSHKRQSLRDLMDISKAPNPTSTDLTNHSKSESQAAAGERAKVMFPSIARLRDGFSLNFDVANFFSSSKSSSSTGSLAPEMRYGLVVKEIEFSPSANLASTGTTYDDLTAAKKAKIHYSIEKLDEEEDRRLFGDEGDHAKNPHGLSQYMPATKFESKIEPTTLGLGKPGAKVSLKQINQRYVMEAFAGQKSPEGYTTTHEFRVPLGKTDIARKFDEKFDLIQTSAYNIWQQERRTPQVNLHYLHRDGRYRAEAIRNRDGWELGVTAESYSSTDRGEYHTTAMERVGLTVAKDI